MKKNLLKATLITTLGAATLACTERGVIIDREDLPEEKAFFVNLLRINKEKQKPLVINPGEMYDADRKLFFEDGNNMEPFLYGHVGDTIMFSNPWHKTFIYVNKNQIRRINGVTNKVFAKQVQKQSAKQR